MDKTIIVIARFKAAQGAETKLKEQLMALLEPSRSDEGCIEYELCQVVDDPARFLFHEIWESKELLEKHLATPHLQLARSKYESLLAEPVEITLLTKIG